MNEGKEISLNLIPFGQQTNGSLVDVHNVPRGKNCGCICPSCKITLVARQGDVNEWHFAHATQDNHNTKNNKSISKCEYSFYVSVRLMARQIISEQLEISLPACKGRLSRSVSPLCDDLVENFTVARAQKITLTGVTIDHWFINKPVDVMGKIGNYTFIIYFTHPDRDAPLFLKNITEEKCGIIEISLNQTKELFLHAQKSKDTYQKILNEFLVNDIKSKKWIFHPRYKLCEVEAKNRLNEKEAYHLKNCQKNNLTKTGQSSVTAINLHYKPIEIKQNKKLANFECINCQTHWQDLDPGPRMCPKCKTHLYTRLLDNVEKSDNY